MEANEVTGWLQIPIFQDALTKRRAGIKPNYLTRHHCPVCKSEFLCPDRYHSQTCEPNDFIKERGWDGADAYTCTPCIMNATDKERAMWYEAHVADSQEIEKQ